MPNLKNILIFVAIGAVLVLGYIFFIKPSSDDTATLVSATSSPTVADAVSPAIASESDSVAQDFLSLLLNVTSLKLNDAIFSDTAFLSLRDSSITLIPDGNEGRPNPFAPIGIDVEFVASTPDALNTTINTNPNPKKPEN